MERLRGRGRPANCFLGNYTQRIQSHRLGNTFCSGGGERSATLSLRAGVPCSTAVKLVGTGISPGEVLMDRVEKLMGHDASEDLIVEMKRMALANIEKFWNGERPGCRLVVVPLPDEALVWSEPFSSAPQSDERIYLNGPARRHERGYARDEKKEAGEAKKSSRIIEGYTVKKVSGSGKGKRRV